jgi:hypothetical protein
MLGVGGNGRGGANGRELTGQGGRPQSSDTSIKSAMQKGVHAVVEALTRDGSRNRPPALNDRPSSHQGGGGD